MNRCQVVIVCPATPASNNGNWRTAQRWQALLKPWAQVRIAQQWPGVGNEDAHCLLALHARKSASSIAAWHARHGDRGLGVVLTGTDIYPDITRDPISMQSLVLARALVVLQGQALQALPEPVRGKASVILQSCSERSTLAKTLRHLRVVAVGHLRDEKNPQMLWRAVRRITPQSGILIDHIGEALAPALGREAQSTALDCPHYRWLQGLSHAATRARIQRAHLLVHTSRSEGGALVIAEAIRSGTPVLATRIPGNVGLLGEDYEGLIEPDDDAALATRLQECRDTQEPTASGLLARWQQQCAERTTVFDPAVEQAALQAWVSTLLA